MKYVVLLLPVLLMSCATSSGNNAIIQDVWVAKTETDEFTDKTTCSITHARRIGSTSVQKVMSLYPLIEVDQDGQVRVGVKSVPLNRYIKMELPVGDVQVRVDSNEAVEIKSFDQTEYQKRITQGDHTAASQEMVSELLSPKTLAEGPIAESLLNQMKEGQTIIMRQITPGNTGETGTFPLAGLKDALNKCGI